jgi:phosphomevalonate kinase
MRAAAPGKLVLSGAYSVLEGAPAIVTAVDRYVIADARREPDLVTPELTAAFGADKVPWFDATQLRGDTGKLGLGSSAAIVAACLAVAALRRQPSLDDARLCKAVYEHARRSHAAAQGGGSGIDVAASCHGGTIVCRRSGDGLEIAPTAVPEKLHVEVWASGTPASTADMLARVRRLGQEQPRRAAELLDRQSAAAEQAAHAAANADADSFLAALGAQLSALSALGDAAGAPIVTDANRRLAAEAERDSAVVIPSGAGGGDLLLFVGTAPPDDDLQALASALGHEPLTLRLGARGVHARS